MLRPVSAKYPILSALVLFGLLVSGLASAAAQTSPGQPPTGGIPPGPGAPGSYLGVQLQAMTDELREVFKVPAGQGVIIVKVAEDSPAAKAGLQVGDVIARMGDKTIADSADVQRGLEFYEPGETVAFEIIRNATPQTISVVLAEPPIAEAPSAGAGQPPAPPFRLPDPKVWREPLEDLMQEMLRQWEELLRELEKAPTQEQPDYL